MPRARIDPFVLIVADRDKKEFTVEGPMVDDNPWNAVVVRAQKSGRNVHCFVPGKLGDLVRRNVSAAVTVYEAEFGYQHKAPGSIVTPPES